MAHKTVSSQSILGQLGANLIERIVLSMGYVWRPTFVFDVGVDGEIEICDPVTGEATNSVIKVQAKATRQSFQAETNHSFEFRCERRDIDYWLRGNAPVILIVCRPERNQAYFVDVKSYFSELSRQKSGKVVFDKEKNRFDVESAESLKALALTKDSGIYFSPLHHKETLYTNLLPVTSYASQIYVAETDYRTQKDIWDKFDSLNYHDGSEWNLKDKMIYSFRNLEEWPYNIVCDVGTLDVFDSSEWAESVEELQKRDFVRLFNACLKAKCWQLGLKHYRSGSQSYYYFLPPTKNMTLEIPYKSLRNQVRREVFKKYAKKNDPDRGAYCRHSAFSGYFVRYDGKWYLEITPTYHFTYDGRRLDLYAATRLAGIKRIERNPAVLGQLLMLSDFLCVAQPSLFTPDYPFLRFGKLVTVDIDVSLPDEVWYQSEDEVATDSDESPKHQLELWEL